MCAPNRIVSFLSLLIVLSFETIDANTMNSKNEKDTSSDNVFILKEVDYNLWKFVPPILYAVGSIGNILTIAVLRR